MNENTKDAIAEWAGIFLCIIFIILFIASVNERMRTNEVISSESFSPNVLKENNMLNENIPLEDYHLISTVMKRHATSILAVKHVDIVDCRWDSQEKKWEILKEYYGCWYSGLPDADNDNNGCYFIQGKQIFQACPLSQLGEGLPEYMMMVSKETFWPLKSNLDITEDGLSVHIVIF